MAWPVRGRGPHRRGGWHYYLAPTGLGNVCPIRLEHVDWRGRGGYVVAPPSRHASGPPTNGPRVATSTRRWSRSRQRCEPGWNADRQRLAGPVELAATGIDPGDRYARAALAQELARVAAAPVGQRNRQLWESTRNLYNLVATGTLDHSEVDHALLAAAERCGLLVEEPRQTYRTLASGRQVGLAHPGRPAQPTSPERHQVSRPLRAAGERTKEGR